MKETGKKLFVALSIIVIAAVFAGIGCYEKFATQNQNSIQSEEAEQGEYKEIKALTDENIKTSEQLRLFENIFKSDKKIILYSYKTKDYPESYVFHKKFQKKIKHAKLKDFKIISVKDGNKYLVKSFKKRNIDTNKDAPSKAVYDLSIVMMDCLSNVCIIDPQERKYIMLNYNPDFVMEEILQYQAK